VDELVIVAPRDDGEAAHDLARAVGARWTRLDDLDAAVLALDELLR
jgi:hypothetical protein